MRALLGGEADTSRGERADAEVALKEADEKGVVNSWWGSLDHTRHPATLVQHSQYLILANAGAWSPRDRLWVGYISYS